MRSHLLRGWAAALGLVLLSLMGCSRCGSESPLQGGTEGIARHLPAQAEATLVVPDLGVLGQRLAILERLKIASFAAQLQGLSSARAWTDSFVSQLGVDIRSPEAMQKAGLAPEKGLAVVALPGVERFVVLGVKDAGAWTQTLAGLVRTRLNAGVRGEVQIGGKKVTTFAPAENVPPALSMVIQEGFAIVALAPAETVARYASLERDASLATSAELQKKLERLEGVRDVWAYIPSGSGLGKRVSLSESLLTLHVTPGALTLRGSLSRPPESPELKLLAPQKDAAPLLDRLPASSFAAFRFSGDPSLLGPQLPRFLGRGLDRKLREAGFDLQAEILSNLQPGIVASLELSPAPPLAAGVPQLDFRRTNPFRYVHLTGFAKVKDAAKAKETFRKLPEVASAFSAQMTPARRADHDVLITSYSQGEGVHLALRGDEVVFASPESRLDALLAAAGKTPQGSGLDAPMRQALEGKAFAAMLDLHRLAGSIQGLPAEAWGIGGFAIKAAVVRWLEATDDLRAVTFSAWARDASVQFEASLRLQTP